MDKKQKSTQQPVTSQAREFTLDVLAKFGSIPRERIHDDLELSPRGVRTVLNEFTTKFHATLVCNNADEMTVGKLIESLEQQQPHLMKKKV